MTATVTPEAYILKGVIVKSINLGGVIAAKATLGGSLQKDASLAGIVQMPVGFEKYKGEYVITPKLDKQIVEAKDKVMSDDITIKSIPYYEVSNTHGGTTFIIGGEKDGK